MFTEDGHWSPESAAALTDLTLKALMAEHEGNGNDFARAMGEVGGRFGHPGIFAVCHAICGIVKKAITNDAPGFASIMVPDGTTPEALPEEMQPDVWAIRFLVGRLNDDDDHMLALWSAQQQDPQHVVKNVVALFQHIVALLRAVEEVEATPWPLTWPN